MKQEKKEKRKKSKVSQKKSKLRPYESVDSAKLSQSALENVLSALPPMLIFPASIASPFLIPTPICATSVIAVSMTS